MTTTTTKQKEITMAVLSEIATKVYPDIPSVKNVPLLLKIQAIAPQEELNKLSVRYRFGEVNPAVWRVVGEFRRELTPNEAHSFAYLLQHKEFEATKVEV